MTVLDLGCGVGDVSMIACELVGRSGHVTGIDIDSKALSFARDRCRGTQAQAIEFLQCSVDDFSATEQFDAVIGRHILIHTDNPLSVLQKAHSLLRPGGVAVFHEYDLAVMIPSYPVVPLREHIARMVRDYFEKTRCADMGARLYRLFLEAGFSAPDCKLEALIGGGADGPLPELLAEACVTILPRAQALGIGTELGSDAEAIAQRLRSEARAVAGGFPFPALVGGFARRS
jgi:SAM-dependent methyltransferase